jgi:3',5'-cyclic-AMP phosphodiesterase
MANESVDARVGFVTVVQLSDTHLHAEPDMSDESPDRRLAELVGALGDLRPDLVLLTGDIADDGSPSAYRRVFQAVSELGVPVLATPGNHDDAAAMAREFGPQTTLVAGAWTIVLLDTSIPGEMHGEVDVHELLDRLGPDEAKPTLLAMHHPPITTSTHEWFQLHGAPALVAALGARRDVRIVVTGHLHQAFTTSSGPAPARSRRAVCRSGCVRARCRRRLLRTHAVRPR